MIKEGATWGNYRELWVLRFYSRISCSRSQNSIRQFLTLSYKKRETVLPVSTPHFHPSIPRQSQSDLRPQPLPYPKTFVPSISLPHHHSIIPLHRLRSNQSQFNPILFHLLFFQAESPCPPPWTSITPTSLLSSSSSPW